MSMVLDAPPDGPRGRSIEVLLAASVMACATLVLSSSASLWADEGDTWTTSATSSSYFIDAIWDWDSHAPLYFAIVRMATVFGDSELVLRLPSILAAAATIVIVTQLAETIAGRAARRPALALATTNALVLFHGSEARNYALSMALAAATTTTLARLAQQQTTGRWFTWGALSAALALSHTLALAVVGAHVLWLIGQWRHGRLRPRAAQGLSLGLVAATAAFMAFQFLRISSSESPFDPMTFKTPIVLARDLIGQGSWWPFVPVGASIAIGAWFLLRPVRTGAPDDPGRPIVWLVLATASVPPVLLLGASLVASNNVAGARYAAVALPAMLALGAAGLVHLPARPSRALLVVIVVTSAAAQVQVISDRDFQDFEGAMAVVRSPPGGAAAVGYFDAFSAWTGAYYLRDVPAHRRPQLLLPERYFPAPLVIAEPPVAIEEVRAAADLAPDLLWLVVRRSEAEAQPEFFESFLEALTANGFVVQDRSAFTGLDVLELVRGDDGS